MLFLTGCNFTCPYCHNPELARGEYPERIPLGEVIDFLSARQGMLDGVAITGGEPTLEKGLADLCKTINALGYPVKLDTNGSRPDVLRRLLDQGLVSFVAMDVKAPLDTYHPFSRHPDIQDRLAESIRLVMERAPAYEFRTTCVSPFINAETIKAIAKTISGASAWVLQAFNHRASCLDPEFNTGMDPAIPTETMQELKSLAAPFVECCTLR